MIKVKKLHWRPVKNDRGELNALVAKDKFGNEHRVFRSWWGAKNMWGWVGENKYHDSREKAKLSVQNAHNKRVLASIDPHPSTRSYGPTSAKGW